MYKVTQNVKYKSPHETRSPQSKNAFRRCRHGIAHFFSLDPFNSLQFRRVKFCDAASRPFHRASSSATPLAPPFSDIPVA
jgi:hypothetical protein